MHIGTADNVKKWAVRVVVAGLIIVGITFLFNVAGCRAEDEKEEDISVQLMPEEAGKTEQFEVQADEEILTVLVGTGTLHKMWASKPFLAIVKKDKAIYELPEGWSVWKGGEPKGLLRTKGLEDGTIIRFERVQ